MADTDRGARARSLLAAGDKDAARALARAWVAEAPREAEAHNTLGVVEIGLRDAEAAEAAFRQAVALDPAMAKAFSNLGGVLRERGDLAGGEDALRRAIQIEPGSHRGWLNLGNVLRQRGRPEPAIDAYRRSISIRASASAHYNLGTLLVERGLFTEAAEQLAAGLELEPEGLHARLLRASLAEALAILGRRDEASELFATLVQRSTTTAEQLRLSRAVLALSGPAQASEALANVEPDAESEGDFWTLRADIAEKLGDLAAAEEAAVKAAAKLKTALGWCAVARLRNRRRDLPGVAAALAQAEEVDPRSALPWIVHADVALAHNDIAGAENALLETRARAPDIVEADVSLGRIAGLRGDVKATLEAQRRVLERQPGHNPVRSNYLLMLHYVPPPSPEVLEEHLAWSRIHAPSVSARFEPRPLADGRKLRVGYVSADLRHHVVARFFEGLIASHDRSRLEIFVYDATDQRDSVTDRLRTHADAWREVHSPDNAALARAVRADDVDVLVDLNGFTADSRLAVMALRPAPVLLSFLGYPDTTGIPAVDARITDALADPPGLADRYATEQLVRLPRCAWTYRPGDGVPDVTPRGLSAPVVFGNFSNVMKFTDEVRKVFAEILRRVPDGRLVLKGRSYDDPQARERFLAPFVEAGVAERVELRKWVEAHLATYNEVDIALDTFPYAGTTTTCEALWMGVPVITVAGDRHSARVGVSLLHAVGLGELVADSTSDYVERAVLLASDRARLAELRSTLRDRMAASPLCDGVSYARAIEDVYRWRYEAYCRFAEQTTDADVWLGLADGAVVSVPDRVDVATRFILEEQGDWFEPERHFVRALLDDGDTAVDVGANFGVYSLSMAKRVGPRGRVLAFEPAPITAAYLRRSAERAAAIRVVQAAVGAERGESLFDLGASPELAELVASAGSAKSSRELTRVDVVPLDDFLDDLSGLVLAKVDAEGAEHLVIAGAKTLLVREDPIWLLELRHGASLNHKLLAALAEKAPHLQLMRWVDRLGALVPFDPQGAVDARWLNVVALSIPRRLQLVARQLAVRSDLGAVLGSAGDNPERDARAAYARAVAAQDATERFEHTLDALGAARQAVREQRTVARLFLLARLAHEAGFDGEAAAAVDVVMTEAAAGARLELPDGALPPLPSQDASMKKLDRAVAVEALAIEARIQLGAWSSYYALDAHEPWLERLRSLDALTPQLSKVRSMIRRLRRLVASARARRHDGARATRG